MTSRKPSALRRWPAALLLAVPSLFSCSKLLDIPDYGPKPSAGVLSCDAKSDHNACGISASGLPRTCFAASQLGGQDTCTDACDVNEGSPDPTRFSCLASGALLQICQPEDPESCPAGLNCFRTDLIADGPLGVDLYPKQVLGLCIAMPLCSDNTQCAAEAPRSWCAGQILRERDKNLEHFLNTDHLQCIQLCDLPPHDCGVGEECLYKLLDPTLPNLCVPKCDTGNCPPNSFCLQRAGPRYPALCVPGLPGFRCGSPDDCLLGYCADTGAGFGLCTVSCSDDSDCLYLNGLREPFVCLVPPGAPVASTARAGICVTKAPYAGAVCIDSGDCPADQHCSDYDPYNPSVKRATFECRRQCDDQGRCASLGNMPYLCLPNGECYPGDMGLPCTSNQECMGRLSCRSAATQASLDGSAALKICTRACLSDADCIGYSNNPKVCVDGFCQLAPP